VKKDQKTRGVEHVLEGRGRVREERCGTRLHGEGPRKKNLYSRKCLEHWKWGFEVGNR